ncbi:calcium-binding protein [Jannaschia sp. 2305UL9-9]|uniref:calcium-binding protein n=1 Tax=Jannaschia sp. 2305UL9-9 TaxID=3121638 RepID=UPI0035291FCA
MTDFRETEDMPSDQSTTFTVGLEDRVAGSINFVGDRDWIRSNLEGGYGYAFRMEGDGTATTITSSELALRNENGEQLTFGYNRSGGTYVSFNPVSDTIVYADLQYWDSVGGYEYFIQRETSNNLSTVANLDVGRQMQGRIDYTNDSDWVRTDITAGYGYIFRMEGDGTADTIRSAEIIMRDDNGEQLTNNFNRSGGTLTVLNPTSDQTVYADLQYWNTLGGYEYSIEREISSNLGTVENLAVGGQMQSRIDYNDDSDWVRTDLAAGYGYVFRMEGDGTGTSIQSTRIVLRGDNGEQLSANFNRSGGTLTTFDPTEDGTVYADLQYWSSTGGYKYSIQQEISRELDTQASMNFGETFISRIDYSGDGDRIAFDGVAGAVYRVSIEGDGTATGLQDHYLGIADALDNSLAGENSRDSTTTLEFLATADQRYSVFVSADGIGRDGEGYRITIEAGTNRGTSESERIEGSSIADRIEAGNGNDTVLGNDGNDTILGGTDERDLRDVIFGGAGNDSIDGGHGNDELRGDAGNDNIAGGFGADTVIGGAGNDTLTGSAFGDEIYGGDGMDFVNGGFGSDRVNGGAGADSFFHLGIADHGSDWIQDYSAADGDVLVFGGAATADQFQINAANTASAGDAGTDEAFIIYRPTGQIIWALVDGMAEAEITLRVGGVETDLLA